MSKSNSTNLFEVTTKINTNKCFIEISNELKIILIDTLKTY